MTKCALLLLLTLAPSAVVSAGMACIQVNPTHPTCADDVCLTVLACVPMVGTVTCTDWRVATNGMIYLDIYVTYDPCQRGGSTKINETFNVGDLCPGVHMVLARVHCSPGHCQPRYAVWAMGATVFKVSCAPCPQPQPQP